VLIGDLQYGAMLNAAAPYRCDSDIGRTLSSLFWRSTAICVASALRCTTNIQTFDWQFITFHVSRRRREM